MSEVLFRLHAMENEGECSVNLPGSIIMYHIGDMWHVSRWRQSNSHRRWSWFAMSIEWHLFCLYIIFL